MDDFDSMHDLLYTLASDLAFCCVGLTDNGFLISHVGYPVGTRFPVFINLTVCERLCEYDLRGPENEGENLCGKCKTK